MTVRAFLNAMFKHDNSDIDIKNIYIAYESGTENYYRYSELQDDSLLDNLVDSYDIYINNGELYMDIYI